jgi:hypothetical protein
MQEDRMSGDPPEGEWVPPAREDAKWQRVALEIVLDECPHQLSEMELVLEVIGDKPSLRERDGCERAIEDLVRGGLLQRCEAMLSPTRAARLFASLGLA